MAVPAPSRMAAWWDLAITLTQRELVVRYKRSVLGLAWALVEPLANVAVYFVVFGVFLGASSQTPNYGLYTLAGLLPWLFLSSTLEQSGNTLLEHAPVIRKVAFPRELLIVAVVASRLTTLLVGVALAVVFAIIAASNGAEVSWQRLLWLPVGLACIAPLAFGSSLVVAALQVLLRDVGFLVRFFLRLGFYACPIVYPLARVPPTLQDWISLNPLVGVLWMFQAFTVPADSGPAAWALVLALIASVAAALLGVVGFRLLMPVVADRI